MRRYLAVPVAALTAAAVLLPTATAEPAADYPTDEYGYVDSAARCDDGQTLVEFGRTSRALVAICIDPAGDLEYRGVRLSDKAGLTMPASRAADGTITATNDGVTYAVTPQMILVSEGDNVLYRDAWTEFHGPSFSTTPSTSAAPSTSTTPSTSTAPSTSAAPSTPAPSSAPSSAAASTPANTAPPTVSTTTVTLTPTPTQST